MRMGIVSYLSLHRCFLTAPENLRVNLAVLALCVGHFRPFRAANSERTFNAGDVGANNHWEGTQSTQGQRKYRLA
jgi:hypothetical protein